MERTVNAARRRGAIQKFEIELPSDLPLVRADATLAEQAIGNIIGNAVSHTPPEARIVVSASAAGNRVVLRVTDNGPGIAPDALPRIFEKFVKGAPEPSSKSNRGTGLGLAIAKGIMEAHGGSIVAESPVGDGRGTQVTMSFMREASA